MPSLFEFSPVAIYALGFLGLWAFASGIYGITLINQRTNNMDAMNCLVVTSDASCTNAKDNISKEWRKDVNARTSYSVSLVINGLIICALSYYIYHSTKSKE
jgi:hypothetical protein